MPAKPEPGKAAPGDSSASPKAGPDVEPTTPKRVPVYHKVKILTASGVKTVQYEVLEDGSYKYLGEVQDSDEPGDDDGPTGPRI